MAESTQEERDRIRHMAHILYHDAYKDEDLYKEGGGKAYPLDWMDIHVNQITSEAKNKSAHWGRASWNADHERNLGIRFDVWRDHRVESQVKLILHEITHEWLSRHDVAFYRRMAENWRRANASGDIYVIDPDINMEVVKWQIPANARAGVYANPRESDLNAVEMVDVIAEELDIDPHGYQMMLQASNASRNGELKLLKNVSFEEIRPKEVMRKAVRFMDDKGEFESTPLAVVNDDMEVIDNHWIANLEWLVGSKYVAVKRV